MKRGWRGWREDGFVCPYLMAPGSPEGGVQLDSQSEGADGGLHFLQLVLSEAQLQPASRVMLVQLHRLLQQRQRGLSLSLFALEQAQSEVGLTGLGVVFDALLQETL